jgi:predicted DNA-binding protein
MKPTIDHFLPLIEIPRLPLEMQKALDRASKETGIPEGVLVLNMLKLYLDKLEKMTPEEREADKLRADEISYQVKIEEEVEKLIAECGEMAD